jgi:hypothetical protein
MMNSSELERLTTPLTGDGAQHGNSYVPSIILGRFADEVVASPSTQSGSIVDKRTTQELMTNDLISWGKSLILIGFAHILFASFLNPTWGVILIILGIITLTIKTRSMFLVLGLGLWVAAFNNFSSGNFDFWTLFGIMQIYWGIKEITKFRIYRLL